MIVDGEVEPNQIAIDELEHRPVGRGRCPWLTGHRAFDGAAVERRRQGTLSGRVESLVVNLAAVKSALRLDPDVALAAAFGSAVRGAASPSSDLDIGVAGVPPSRLPALAVTLSRLAECEVDLIQLETAPPLLRFEIARDGVLLAERTAGLWPAFQARAMVDWWEWAPTARRFAHAAFSRLSSGRP